MSFDTDSDETYHEPYEEMEDTPWITQGRQIASAGGQGILDNYNSVNVFDEDTLNDIKQRNADTYSRAYDTMNDQYNKMMNAYAAANYNQFGTLNATPASYITSQYQKDMMQQLDDLAYNQAMNYDTLIDNELNRRYNTLNMYNNMYNMGNTAYQQDVANWNTRNTNKDIDYQNQVVNSSSSNDLISNLLSTGTSAATSAASTSNPYSTLVSALYNSTYGGGTM